MSKHASSASYNLSEIGHSLHRSDCIFGAFFDLLTWTSLWIFLRLCCLLFLCMRLASYFSNGGFVPSCLYMSWSLSSRSISIEHMVVPFGLCNVLYVFVLCGCCASSYLWVGCVSRSGLTGVVENARIGDLHHSDVLGFTWGVRLFVLLWVCVLCLYCARAVGPLLHSVMVDPNCHVGCQFTS